MEKGTSSSEHRHRLMEEIILMDSPRRKPLTPERVFVLWKDQPPLIPLAVLEDICNV